MKYTAALLFAGAALVSAQADGQYQVTDVPGCALQCFLDNVKPTTGCDPVDTKCQCMPDNRAKLLPVVTPCVTKSCDFQQGLRTLQVTNGLCAQAGFPVSGNGLAGAGGSASGSASASASSGMGGSAGGAASASSSSSSSSSSSAAGGLGGGAQQTTQQSGGNTAMATTSGMQMGGGAATPTSSSSYNTYLGTEGLAFTGVAYPSTPTYAQPSAFTGAAEKIAGSFGGAAIAIAAALAL